MRNNVFWLCGDAGDNSSLSMRTTTQALHSILFCTHFVRNMRITLSTSALVLRVLCAQKTKPFQSITSLVFPAIHSPYYYVCSDLSKKLINNRRCA